MLHEERKLSSIYVNANEDQYYTVGKHGCEWIRVVMINSPAGGVPWALVKFDGRHPTRLINLAHVQEVELVEGEVE